MAALALPSAAAANHGYVSKWGTFGGANGEFDGPSGLDTDALDNVYVADFQNDRVQVFTPDGDHVMSFATGDGPLDVAVDSFGSIYVANQNTDNVQKFNSSGIAQVPLVGSFLDPSGVAVDSNDNVYVADRGHHQVQRFTSAGVPQLPLGGSGPGPGGSGPGPGEFSFPSGVEVFGTTLYVADSGNHRIQRLSTTDGSFLGQWGNNTVFSGPSAVAVSADGSSVFVADSGNDRVRVFDAVGDPGTPPHIIGSSGSADGQFNVPRGVATGSLNSVFVTDLDNNRVQKFAAPVSGSSVRTSGTRLVFDAEANRRNSVSVTQSGSIFTFTEVADADGADTITPGAGCVQNGSNSVTCTNPSIVRLSLTVRELDDTVTVQSSVSSSVAATINGGTGADVLTGGLGTDTASYSDFASPVTVDLANGTATGGDTLSGIENAAGGDGGDTFVSGSGANVFTGGIGSDTVSYAQSGTDVTASLASGTGSGGDTFSGIENLTGSPQNDNLTGDPGNLNTIICGAGTGDSATAQIADTVDADCESVVRTDAVPPGGGSGGGSGGGGTGGGGATPAPSGPGVTPAPSAPTLSSLTVAKMRTGKPGTFSYSLNKAAGVTITIARVQAGRKSGSVCKKQTRRNRKRRACTMFVPVGKLTQSGVAGRNTLRFSGKLAGRKLPPGVYRATAVATGATGAKSAAVTTKFAVSR